MSRKKSIWNRIKRQWFGLSIGLVGVVHGWFIVTKQIDLATAGGAFSTFIVALTSVKTALKDE